MPDDTLTEPTNIFKSRGFITAIAIVGCGLAAYGMINLEIIRRAHNAYQRGEQHFADKRYKEAMWDYQEAQEFYMLPRSKWVDMSAEKEWICRAYLGDWVPPEGPLDADIRTLPTRNGFPPNFLPNDYPKYKDEIATITPVGDNTYQPAPLTTDEKSTRNKKKKNP